MAHSRPDDDHDALKTLLRRAGLRATRARIAVLGLLRASSHPLSHADVATALVGKMWDRATLYRNLVDMVDAGLLRRSDVDHVWRFEMIFADEPQHPHFVCIECGTVECMADVELAVRKPQRVPHSVRTQEVEIQLRGRCDQCISA